MWPMNIILFILVCLIRRCWYNEHKISDYINCQKIKKSLNAIVSHKGCLDFRKYFHHKHLKLFHAIFYDILSCSSLCESISFLVEYIVWMAFDMLELYAHKIGMGANSSKQCSKLRLIFHWVSIRQCPSIFHPNFEILIIRNNQKSRIRSNCEPINSFRCRKVNCMNGGFNFGNVVGWFASS